MLTRPLQEAVQHQQPPRAGMFRPKLRYAHQGGMNPPMIVIHGNSLEHVTDAYRRFLEGRFREAFKLRRHAAADRDAARAQSRIADGDVAAAGLASIAMHGRVPSQSATSAAVMSRDNMRSLTTRSISMSNKGQLLQDPFLNTLRKEHVPVSIYLVNGIKLQGQIESFDQYVVLLRTP